MNDDDYKTIFQPMADVLQNAGKTSYFKSLPKGLILNLVGDWDLNIDKTNIDSLKEYCRKDFSRQHKWFSEKKISNVSTYHKDSKNNFSTSKQRLVFAIARSYLFIKPTKEMLEHCISYCESFNLDLIPEIIVLNPTPMKLTFKKTGKSTNMFNPHGSHVKLKDYLLRCNNETFIRNYSIYGTITPINWKIINETLSFKSKGLRIESFSNINQYLLNKGTNFYDMYYNKDKTGYLYKINDQYINLTKNINISPKSLIIDNFEIKKIESNPIKIGTRKDLDIYARLFSDYPPVDEPKKELLNSIKDIEDYFLKHS